MLPPPLHGRGMVGSGSLRAQAFEREDMAVVETERDGQILQVRMQRADLGVAAKGAVSEVREAKRWRWGGYNHGHIANLPYPVAMEMALGFRFTAERFYEIGFLNRLAEPDKLMESAFAMAEHLLTLPPASRVNTVHMIRQMRPGPSPEQQHLAAAPHEHRAKSELLESRAA